MLPCQITCTKLVVKLVFFSSSVLCINFVYMAIFDQIETHEECNVKCGLISAVCMLKVLYRRWHSKIDKRHKI